MSLGPGQEWGSAAEGPPGLDVAGSDADLAAALCSTAPGVLVRFSPQGASDVARAVGLVAGAPCAERALPMDVLALADRTMAVNAVVLGIPPDRLCAWHRRQRFEVAFDGGAPTTVSGTTVLVLVGQYLRGADVSPRGHPGDGVCEVQVYDLPPGQRGAMRARLGAGAHLPHPAITIRRARSVTVRAGRRVGFEVDGRRRGRARTLEATLLAGRYSLMV